MSIAGLIDPEMNHNKKSFHRRNDSGELDVFEAARYFSGYNEVVGYTTGSTTFTQKIMREERHGGHRARISLDMPMRSLLPQQFHGVVVEKQIMKEKKHKQPSSPGGRLASFLNSLFSQSASKKKKSTKSSSSSQSMKDIHEDESPGGRRRRRSSISHFRSSSTTTADSRSTYSSMSSGFRTPPYVVQTPTKSCKEFRTLSEHKHAVSLPTTKQNNNGHVKSSTTLQNELWGDKKKREPITLLDDNHHKHSSNNGLLLSSSDQKQRILPEKEIRKFNEVVDVDDDDGAESDSSSDLFELQNYDLGYYSSGLPVYETTNMDNIKRGAQPISNVP